MITQTIRTLQPGDTEFPDILQAEVLPNIHTLYVRGNDLQALLSRPCVAIVGSRKVSAYGRAVTIQLARELAERGVVVISGLAIGIDGIAHGAVLEVGGQGIAVLPAGLDHIYPTSHEQLARGLLQNGGALVSEYPPGSTPYKQNFVARNRIVSALSDAVVITEAAEKSGSLHTARFALEQGKEVLCVPGNVTSETSRGTNTLIKSGATPVTEVKDILYALQIEDHASMGRQVRGTNEHEQLVLDLMQTGVQDGQALLVGSQMNISLFNQVMTMLEIRGVIRPAGNNTWHIS
jgi:DNA processing protein